MAGFNPSEPRVPAGSSAGGTWGGGSTAAKAPAKKATAAKAPAKKATTKKVAGAGWKGGKARDAAAGKVQADPAAQGLYNGLLGLPAGKRQAYAHGLADDKLELLTQAIYSEHTSDPNIVQARIAVANEMSRRGLDIKKYGALGGGIGASRPSAPSSKGAPPKTVRKASPAQVKAVAKVQTQAQAAVLARQTSQVRSATSVRAQ